MSRRREYLYREGISDVTAGNVASAREMGSVVKLLAICERDETPGGATVAVRVHPAMIPRSHPLASVRGAYNAVFVESDAAGQLMFYGPGAGGAPTASAVLGDVVTVARNRLSSVTGAGESAYAQCEIAPMGNTVTRYHVGIDVDDKPGVLAAVAELFAQHDVSIQTVPAEGSRRRRPAGRGHPRRSRCRVGGDGRRSAFDADRPRRDMGDARRGGR